MISKIMTVVLVLVSIEIIALLWLATSIGRYKTFWQHKAQESGDITYLALGDSAAQGIGASSPMRGYVGLIANQLHTVTGKHVRIINLSVTGATLADYLRDQAPKITAIKADYVTIEIGANDVKTFKPATFEKQFRQVIASLPKGTYVANMPLFNSRPNSTQPAKEASKIVAKLVSQNPQLHFVDLQKQTIEHQSIFGFAPDLFHPNNASYKNWYHAFWDAISKSNL